MAAGVARAGFDDVRELPLADGGEGTLDALLAARGGSRRRARVTGPLGDPVDAEWGVLPNGTAVVEMARASGLALVGARNDPLRASTRGTGELIAVSRREGCKEVVVAVGGSASTDGGLGAVEALGWSLQGIKVTVACDVATPFVDAARVYGPQKGATDAQVALLTRRLERLADEYAARRAVDVRALWGGGAAGGLAGGLAALGAQLVPGFEVVAEVVRLEEALRDADLVVTGEGRFDLTSLEGKVPGEVVAWCMDAQVDAVAVIAGQIDPEARARLPRDAVLAVSLTDRAWDLREAYERAALLVEEAAYEAARWALGRRGRRRRGT
jgi:glycerate kinase